MNFFRKLFAPQHPLDSLRKAVRQQRWADAVVEGELVPRDALPADERDELERLVANAGDALAELNFVEGEASLRSGDTARAQEHFTLAATHARNPQYVVKARELFARAAAGATVPHPPPAASCCPSGCGGGNHHSHVAMEGDDFDSRTRLDLLLGSYPPELAARYAEIDGPFLHAFLLAHEGELEKARKAFAEVPEKARDDLFFFERGALLARCGEEKAALADLEMALTRNPHLDLAIQMLVTMDLAAGRLAAAEARLRQQLQEERNVPFALGRLAALHAGRGEKETALDYALRAIPCGAEAETLVLAGTLLEEGGRFAEAEACLARLSTSGCGSLNLHLAEFWLRRGQNSEKALQTFQSALRHEPENPRWKMRIGQSYLACGWPREGIPLLRQAIDDHRLDKDLREEASRLLASAG